MNAELSRVRHGRAVLRLAVLQRVCPAYRVPLFSELAGKSGFRVRLFVGSDLSHSKVRSGSDLGVLDVVKLPTRQIRIRNRVFLLHVGLLRRLVAYQPDVILCEGESNLLSALKAVVYRVRFPRTALVHWSLGGLPGQSSKKRGPRRQFLKWFRRMFDAHVVYSSFGAHVLAQQGVEKTHTYVATNVSNVEEQLVRWRQLELTRAAARAHLGLPERFTALFVGSLESAKRVDVLIEAARRLDPKRVSVVLAGDGPLRVDLERATLDCSAVRLIGAVREQLAVLYRAADVLVLPGRGGMVISEAMANAVPVIAYQADGSELDLVVSNRTGILLKTGESDEIAAAISALCDDPETCDRLGRGAQQFIAERFGVARMSEQICAAVMDARNARSAYAA